MAFAYIFVLSIQKLLYGYIIDTRLISWIRKCTLIGFIKHLAVDEACNDWPNCGISRMVDLTSLNGDRKIAVNKPQT